jgi:hypothetical protein
MRLNKLFFPAILLLPILLLAPTLAEFHVFPGSGFSDLAISHYPNTYFLQQSLIKYHVVPLWNPNILGGYPFDADPLSGLWYPPGWISLLFPLPFGINLTILLHIIFGGYGFYQYLRTSGYSQPISLFGMACFVLFPKLYAHFGAGHVTLIYAFCITPWLFWSESLSGRSKTVMQGIFLAGVVLADIRWLPYAVVGMCANKIWYWQQFGRKRLSFLQVFQTVSIGIGISAVFWMPFLQFTSLSTREAMTVADNLYLSLPLTHLINLFLPISGGSPEWVIYIGGCCLLLALIGILKGNRYLSWIWSVSAVLVILWALGSSIPGMQFLAGLPGVHSLRVPPRGMLLGDLAIIILAVEGLDFLVTRLKSTDWKRINLLGFAVVVLLVIISGAILLISGKMDLTLLIGPGVLLVVFICMNIFHDGKIQPQLFIFLVVGLIIIDFLQADLRQFTPNPEGQSTEISSNLVEQINTHLGSGKIYTPSYSIPQEFAILHGWELANGVHPLQYARYTVTLEKASGVLNSGYNVVQPPLKTGNPYEDNRYAVPDTKVLAALDVSLVASSFPINANGLGLLDKEGNLWLYQNIDFLPLPRIEGSTGNKEINVLTENPNKTEYWIETNGGILLTDQIQYPGRFVLDNGKKVTPQDSKSLFISIALTPGQHQIRIVYQPEWTYIGLFVSIITVLLAIYYLRYSHAAAEI